MWVPSDNKEFGRSKEWCRSKEWGRCPVADRRPNSFLSDGTNMLIRWAKPFYPMVQTFYPMGQTFSSDGTHILSDGTHLFI